VGCVEGILGIRPSLHGIKIAPSIPREWKELEIDKEFRGRKLHIWVRNPHGRESGCERLLVNGRRVEGSEIPESLLTEETEIEVTL
jgi:cellobiose phosphorylase